MGSAEITENAEKRIMMLDIDGTVVEDIPNEEPERMGKAKALPGAVEWVNRLYDTGHYICFITARTDEHMRATEQNLKKHGFRFHRIIYNKPRRHGYSCYHYVDNAKTRASTFSGKFSEFVKKKTEIEVLPD